MFHLLHYIVPCSRWEEWYSLWCPCLITPPRWSPSCDLCRPCTQIHHTEKHQCLATSWHLNRIWLRQKHQQKSRCWTSCAGTRRRAVTSGACQRFYYWTQLCYPHCRASTCDSIAKAILMGALNTMQPVLQWADTYQWPTAHCSKAVKGGYWPQVPIPPLQDGDLVYVKSDWDKSRTHDRYIIVSIDGE